MSCCCIWVSMWVGGWVGGWVGFTGWDGEGEGNGFYPIEAEEGGEVGEERLLAFVAWGGWVGGRTCV